MSFDDLDIPYSEELVGRMMADRSITHVFFEIRWLFVVVI
jgi:hypothetical protein